MVGTGTYYLHADALGSIRLETTITVTVRFSSNYVPNGKNYAVSGKAVFMYTGKMHISNTGLYYEGARYYYRHLEPPNKRRTPTPTGCEPWSDADHRTLG